ncbi:hypothetical protein HanOQP8_Chr10g0377031 [Helianthus annuus]|nr:hypothetical protein HanOQP8_Chr10g0377031 [Helianthus annuus]
METVTLTNQLITQMSTSERTPVEIVKSVNGLEKVVLREIHGSSVEVGYCFRNLGV